MDEHKAAMYLVAIVGIVAAVGILVLLIGNGVTTSGESDITGQTTQPNGGCTAGQCCLHPSSHGGCSSCGKCEKH